MVSNPMDTCIPGYGVLHSKSTRAETSSAVGVGIGHFDVSGYAKSKSSHHLKLPSLSRGYTGKGGSRKVGA